jgi:glutathione S-transferase
MLLEADLPYDSAGNSVEVFRSAELRKIHPLGKLPAAIIDGTPLFESAAIVTAIADLVQEKGLIAGPGTWSRNLHYQWVCFALTEMEPYLHSTEINSIEFVLPKSQHVPAIIEQNAMMYKRAAALDHLAANLDPGYERLEGGQRHRATNQLLAAPTRTSGPGGVDAVQPDQVPAELLAQDLLDPAMASSLLPPTIWQ